MNVAQIDNKRCNYAGHIAHDVDECNTLSTNDRWQNFSHILQPNVVRNVDPKSANDGHQCRIDADGKHCRKQTEYSAQHQRSECVPASTDDVQCKCQQNIGWHFGSRRNRKCNEHVQSQCANISYMAVECQRYCHPNDNKQQSDLPQSRGFEKIDRGIAAVGRLFFVQACTAFLKLIVDFRLHHHTIDPLEFLQYCDGFCDFTLRY